MKPRTLSTTRWASAAILSAIVIAAPWTASAQSDEERAGARAAATEGAAAMEQKRWADAIDLFSRAESLVHAPPHLLYLARAYANTGKLVKARETYQKLIRESLPTNAPKPFINAQTEGSTELAALEARVPTLKVALKGPSEGVTVKMDDVAVPSALIGVPRPVDPGTHTLQATGKGVASDPVTITLKEGVKESLEIELKPAAGAAAAPVGPAAATPVQPAAAPVTETAPGGVKDQGPAPKKSNTLRTVSYVALGGGVAGLAVGTIFALKSHDKRLQGDELCPGGTCKASDKDKIDSLDSEATSAGQLAVTGFVVGGAALATGVTLFILSGRKQDTAPAKVAGPTVVPWVGLGSAGFSGRF